MNRPGKREKRLTRVLVVDDQREFRIPLEEALKSAGYHVDCAIGKTDAIDQAEEAKGNYDFVLVDQYLPGANDGLELVQAIRRKFPNLKVILLTQYGDAKSAELARKIGAFRCIFRSGDPKDNRDVIAVMKAAKETAALENVLRDKNSLLKNVLDNAGVGITIIDRAYRILYLNGEQRKISRPQADVGGICWFEFNNQVRRRTPCPWCATQPAIEKRKPRESITFSPVGGKTRVYRVLASPIFGARRKVIAAMEFVRDITEAYLAERQTAEAGDPSNRLNGMLQGICALGYSRARLYELAEDGLTLRGRIACGDANRPISEVSLLVTRDRYLRETVKKEDLAIRHRKRRATPPSELDRLLDRDAITEWLDIPLIEHDVCLGVITVDNHTNLSLPPGGQPIRPDRITKRDFARIKLLASATAREMWEQREKHREREESRRLRELRRLAEMVAKTRTARATTAQQSTSVGPVSAMVVLEKDLDEIVKSAVSLTGANAAHLRLWENERLVLKGGVGPYYEIAKKLRQELSLDHYESASVKAWNARKPYIQPDTAKNKHFARFIQSLTDTAVQDELRKVQSLAAFPIQCGGTYLGVLTFQSNHPSFFSKSICEVIEDYAGMIGPLCRIETLITELQAAKDQLQIAARMAAHRLRNPNFAIQGQVYLWMKQKEKGLPDETFTAEVLESISADSTRIARIVNDLQRFLKGPMISLPGKPVEINPAIHAVVSGTLAKQPEVHYRLDLGQDLPKFVLDAKLIGEMVEQLLENACKAMENCGTITVKTRMASTVEKLVHGLPETRSVLYLEVSDTGPGVPEDMKQKVFEPFVTTGAEKSGLGLAITRDVVRAMDGIAEENGMFGQGARFVLLIPSAG